MGKLCVIAALAVLTGCASSQSEPETLAASIVPGDQAPPAELASTPTVIDISDPENQVRTVCKPHRPTGSHLIRGVDCTSPSPEPRELTGLDKMAAEREEWELRRLQRARQDDLLRSQADQVRRSYVPAR